MTRAFTRLLRLIGCIALAVSDEIDRALSTYAVEVPPVIPEWLHEDVDQ